MADRMASWVAALLCVAATATLYGAPTAETRPAVVAPGGPKSPVPDKAALEKADQFLHSVFKDAFEQVQAPAAQSALARRLAFLAPLNDDDLALRYVLLREVRDLASAGGDSDTALFAVARMQLWYGRHDPNELLEWLTVAGKAAETDNQPQLYLLVGAQRNYLRLIDSALAACDGELAKRTAGEAKSFLDALPNHRPIDLLLNEAIERAESLPTTGVPKAPASKDFSGPPAEAAAAWWDAAEKQPGPQQQAFRLRAAELYAKVAADLPDAERARAIQRVEQVHAAMLQPGLLTDLYDGANFERRQVTRIDRDIDVDWHEQPPDSFLRNEYFSICWQGYLKAPAAGRYAIEVDADDGVVLLINDRVVVNEFHDYSGHPYTVEVELTDRPQALEVIIAR